MDGAIYFIFLSKPQPGYAEKIATKTQRHKGKQFYLNSSSCLGGEKEVFYHKNT